MNVETTYEWMDQGHDVIDFVFYPGENRTNSGKLVDTRDSLSISPRWRSPLNRHLPFMPSDPCANFGAISLIPGLKRGAAC